MSRDRSTRRVVRTAVAVLVMVGVTAVAVTVPVAIGPRATAVAACSIGTTTLRNGSRGTAVTCLQRTLVDKGYPPGPIDGIFGSMTEAAVRRFQRARGLTVDGVVGPQTGTALGIWGDSVNCRPPAGVPSRARQVVVVDARGTVADVDLRVHNGSSWVCVRTDMYARIGRNGIRRISRRVAGDGTTPAGVFPLATMTAPDGQTFQFFGNGKNPGVRGRWRRVRAGDCWDASGGDAAYNTLTHRSAARCGPPDEYLPNYQTAYAQAALIGANMGPRRFGDAPGETPRAAAIFLHRHSWDGHGNTRPTAGCVSLGLADLDAVFAALRPGEAFFVIR